jgi:hypothetical protein
MMLQLHFDSIQARDAFMDEPAPEGVSRYVEACDSTDGGLQLFLVVLNLTREVSVGIISAWLYDRMIKGKLKTVSYKRGEIRCDEGEIRKVIEEHITGSNGDG